MTSVFAWPPVRLLAWELSVEAPISVSRSRLTGARYVSGRGRKRRVATAEPTGRGAYQSGSGYVEMLKDLLAGGEHLVRMRCPSSIWMGAALGRNLRNCYVEVRDDGTPVYLSDGVTPVKIPLVGQPGTATLDGIWPAIHVTGLPPHTVVARPHELVRVLDPDGNDQMSRVLTVAISDGEGEATIRLQNAVIADEAPVSIGGTEEIVFEAVELPRAVQPATGGWSYLWSFREVFPDEYPDGWVEADPWS